MAITYETLDQAHDDLMRAANGIADNIEALKRDLDGSLSQWTGEASNAYTRAKIKWQSAIDDMNSVLAAAFLHLEKTSEMYKAVEQRNVSIWNP
jgi:WXG100 family type VII secretion target